MGRKIWLWGLTVVLSAMACTQPAKAPAGEGENPVVSFEKVEIPAVLQDSLRRVMESYTVLTGALAAGDTLLTDAAAAIMKRRLDSLPLYKSGLDSAYAGALELNTGSMAAELAAMPLEHGGLEGRQHSYEMASEQLFDLLRQTGAVSGVMYRFHCPEAFGGHGAYWLGSDTVTVNPYGVKAVCAVPKDTIR